MYCVCACACGTGLHFYWSPGSVKCCCVLTCLTWLSAFEGGWRLRTHYKCMHTFYLKCWQSTLHTNWTRKIGPILLVHELGRHKVPQSSQHYSHFLRLELNYTKMQTKMLHKRVQHYFTRAYFMQTLHYFRAHSPQADGMNFQHRHYH